MRRHRGKKGLARNLRRTQTDAERVLWQRLRDRQVEGYKFRRQYQIGEYVVDFACPDRRLVIEVDGGQHQQDEQALKDSRRTEKMQADGFKVVRFWDNDVLRNTDEVIQTVRSELLEDRAPSP